LFVDKLKYEKLLPFFKAMELKGGIVNFVADAFVVEDVRVEKLMKRRYAGLAKTFFNGYKELAEQEFFQLNNDDVSSYSLADRTNLLFKIGRNEMHFALKN
jgi:hypothetical protein